MDLLQLYLLISCQFSKVWLSGHWREIWWHVLSSWCYFIYFFQFSILFLPILLCLLHFTCFHSCEDKQNGWYLTQKLGFPLHLVGLARGLVHWPWDYWLVISLSAIASSYLSKTPNNLLTPLMIRVSVILVWSHHSCPYRNCLGAALLVYWWPRWGYWSQRVAPLGHLYKGKSGPDTDWMVCDEGEGVWGLHEISERDVVHS